MALDNVSLMSWTTAEIEEQSERQPKLGIALMQMLIKRGLDYQARLESFALDKTPERVVRSLLRFAERMGTPTDDGASASPLTHQILAQYVGTTREIITFQMNQLRQKGLLRYSRKGIQIYPHALREYLTPAGASEPRLPRISLRSPHPLRKSTHNLGYNRLLPKFKTTADHGFG